MTQTPARLFRIVDRLPVGFARLQAEARTEGYRFLDRLAADWEAGAMRFTQPGEVLLAACANEVLAAIGGLTREPMVPGGFRMRRFYVGARFRRTGLGRRLAAALLESPLRAGHPVTVNAATGSAPFWEALGFAPDPYDGHTHVLRSGSTPPPLHEIGMDPK